MVAPDRNVHSGTELGKWIGSADFRSADVFTALLFHNENFYVDVE